MRFRVAGSQDGPVYSLVMDIFYLSEASLNALVGGSIYCWPRFVLCYFLFFQGKATRFRFPNRKMKCLYRDLTSARFCFDLSLEVSFLLLLSMTVTHYYLYRNHLKLQRLFQRGEVKLLLTHPLVLGDRPMHITISAGQLDHIGGILRWSYLARLRCARECCGFFGLSYIAMRPRQGTLHPLFFSSCHDDKAPQFFVQ